MKLLVFAHKPPPHHGQSYMVQLLLETFGGDRRGSSDASAKDKIACYHVDCRVSRGADDIGQRGWAKVPLTLKYCLQAIWCRFRYGAHNLYYVPAPGMRTPLYRDWIVMALCRPFFRRVIFHWHAVGLGTWLTTEATPLERWISRRLLGRSDLSIVQVPSYQPDLEVLQPRRVIAIPNGIPDPCPEFDGTVRPLRRARLEARQHLLAGRPLTQQLCQAAGTEPETFRVLFLSQCSREKGLFDALEAIALLNRKLAQQHAPIRATLSVAGPFWHAADKQAFAERIREPDLADDRRPGTSVVSYAGFISGPEKRSFFRQCDCFSFPTFYPFEGLPVSVLEAMAFGLPIVTTQWRALPELVPPGYPGLAPIHSPQRVADRLERFLTECPGEELRRRFEEHFLLCRFAEKMQSALEAVMAREE